MDKNLLISWPVLMGISCNQDGKLDCHSNDNLAEKGQYSNISISDRCHEKIDPFSVQNRVIYELSW